MRPKRSGDLCASFRLSFSLILMFFACSLFSPVPHSTAADFIMAAAVYDMNTLGGSLFLLSSCQSTKASIMVETNYPCAGIVRKETRDARKKRPFLRTAGRYLFFDLTRRFCLSFSLNGVSSMFSFCPLDTPNIRLDISILLLYPRTWYSSTST